MVDLIDFEQERLDDVVSDELEPWVTEMVHHVLFPSGEEVIDHDHAIASLHQTVHQVGPNETGPAGHHDPQTLAF